MKVILILASILALGSLVILESFAEEEWNESLVIANNYSQSIDEKFYKIPYFLSHGNVEKIETDTALISIFVNIDYDSNLKIKIPRSFPVSNSSDEIFRDEMFVIVNYEEIKKYEKIKTECYYEFSIPLPKNSNLVELAWDYLPFPSIPFKGEEVPNYCITQTIFVISPNVQIKNGVEPDEIFCKDGYELILKASDNSPACVKPSSIQKLIDRGWTNFKSVELFKINKKFPVPDFDYETLSKLLEQYQQVSIIVQLEAEYTLVGKLSEEGRRIQEERINKIFDELITDMPKKDFQKVKKFKYGKGFVINADKETVDYLVSSSLVNGIFENKEMSLTE